MVLRFIAWFLRILVAVAVSEYCIAVAVPQFVNDIDALSLQYRYPRLHVHRGDLPTALLFPVHAYKYDGTLEASNTQGPVAG